MFRNRFTSFILIIVLFFFTMSYSALAYNRQESDRLTTLGLKALKRGNNVKAERYLTSSIKEDPTNDRAHAALGDYYYLIGKHDKAVEEFKKAIKMGADSHQLTLRIGKARYLNKQYKQAIVHLKKLEHIYQRDPKVFILLGDSYRQVKDFRNSEKKLNKAIMLDANSMIAHLFLGELYWENNKLRKARAEFEIVRDLPATSQGLKEEMDIKISKIDNTLQEGKLWRLAIPAMVIMIIIPSFLILKKHKRAHPEDLEEEEFYG
ncbi:MAG: tetratricopeptide repeat protein [Candidatus Eremiobacteraeota bacterium]|nr:tetratricopeptide repeat protein [Candidatus Eremiobacteraeota bacterium]